jgi:hypothetical protein
VRPRDGLKPKEGPALRIEGRTRVVKGAGLKKNWRYWAVAIASTRGDSGNYSNDQISVCIPRFKHMD